MSHTIKPGDYVIVQRQRYTKLYKVKPKGNLTLGYFIIEIDKVIGEPYETIFQMKPKQDSKKLYSLEKVEQLTTISQLNIESSGKDNRNITDDGT
ncbi:gcd10p family [Holotrichia oblita]|nr:gcd10p family [Holotrichia oblita]